MPENERADIASWLAEVLGTRTARWPFADSGAVDAVMSVANTEGVVAPLSARIRTLRMSVPDALRERLDVAVREKVVQSLHQQAQCRAVLARLSAAGIPALILKGMALAQWAYEKPYLRDNGDVDLLLPARDDVERAVAALEPLGYALSEDMNPGDLARFESTCVHAGSDRLELDLHWRLSNVPVFAFRFSWDELWAQSMALPPLAPTARALSPVPSMIHACMHRTKHLATGQDRLKWLYDLVVMAARFAADDWCALCDASARHGVAGVCLVNLQQAEATFGAFVPDAIAHSLAAAAQAEPWRAARLQRFWYFQWMNWRAFPTWRMRWRWLWQQLVPGAAFLRKRHGTGHVAVALWRRMATGVRRLRG